MALQGTKAQFAELYSDLSDYKGDDLYAHAEALIKWEALSEIAELEIEDNDSANDVYEDVLIYHNNNMWLFAPDRDIPTLSERAFTLALVSIELARADAQKKAVAVLLKEMDKLLYNDRDVITYHQAPIPNHTQYNDALMAAKTKLQSIIDAKHKSGESDFYIDMISKLGPRLDPVNQSAILVWVAKNGMTDHSDLSNSEIRFAEGIENPDSYTRFYDRDAKGEAGETLLEIFTRKGLNFNYSPEYRGWATTLLLKDHQRYVGEIDLPNVDDDGTTHYAVWVSPLNDRDSRVFLVDEDQYDNSRLIHGLVKSFSDAANASTDDEQRARFRKGQSDLVELIRRKLQTERLPHDIDFALNEGGGYTLSHLNNG